jgi:hypothetical protein
MKRALIALTLGLATLTLTACDDGYGYGGVYSASYYPHYRYNDRYYDGYYYAPATRGYWSGNRYYHRRGDGDARSHRWKDDDRGNRGRGKRHRDRD